MVFLYVLNKNLVIQGFMLYIFIVKDKTNIIQKNNCY
jgi:hypothetical protein